MGLRPRELSSSGAAEREERHLDDIRQKARKFAAGSIVTDALARLLEQILTEVHETHIAPRDKRIEYLEGICASLGSPEHAIKRDLSKTR